MNIVNRTPFVVFPLPGYDENGKETISGIVKGTFRFQKGEELAVADEPEPIHLADEYWGEPGKSPLKWESDLVPFKPGTDLLLTGNAYASKGSPSKLFKVSFEVGTIRKKAEFRIPEKKTKASLRALERFEIKRDLLGRRKTFRGLGFGFYPRAWKPRLRYAGTYDEKWQKSRAPFLPEDFDPRFFQCAYPDLIATPHLKGGEKLRAENVSKHGLLRARLPNLRVSIALHVGKEIETQRAKLDTVHVEADQHRVVVIWRARFLCGAKLPEIRALEVQAQPRERTGEQAS